MKKNIILVVLLIGIFLVTGCSKTTTTTTKTTTKTTTTTTTKTTTTYIDLCDGNHIDRDKDLICDECDRSMPEYVYDGVETVAPYKVYNGNGEVVGEFDNMFIALRTAGVDSTSKNKQYVKDANDLTIFEYGSLKNNWCFDGTHFVGIKTESAAKEWAETHKRCFILSGRGSDYKILGTDYYPGSDLSKDIPLELFSGGYNYMFSKSGYLVSDAWERYGYGYGEFICRLSEANYHRPEDGNGWNAYIFINGSGGDHSDLGLIGIYNQTTNQVDWDLVRNCSHTDHDTDETHYGPHFNVLSRVPVTSMSYDKDNDCFNGADDLKFVCYQGTDGWTLTITNLRTNEDFVINEKHTGMFNGKQGYFRFLIAASYCPVVGNSWNALSGAYLENVVFDNIKIAEWNESETYNQEDLKDFYPEEETFNYGYSQAAYCSSYAYGIRKEDGSYKSGNTYKKGDKYLIYDCFYDGRLDK